MNDKTETKKKYWCQWNHWFQTNAGDKNAIANHFMTFLLDWCNSNQ